MKTILTLAVASFLVVLAWAQGQPSANEMNPKIAASAENRRYVGIYGKVIDQDGNPITDVDVTGSVSRMQGWYEDDKWESHTTQTDTNGLFQFIGLTGAGWNVSVKKYGYEIDYQKGWSGPKGGEDGSQTSPDNRVILTMYKRHGAEPMVHDQMHAYIPCDGSVTRFDLLTGKQNTNGDLTVSLTRNPLNINRSKPFDWSVTFAVTNGGLQEITNIYPNEAPAVGYQSTVTVNFPTNMVGWQSEFQNSYYFKSKNGQVYGRIIFDIYGNFQPPPTDFEAEIYANPNGSRNLEFDSSKEIEIPR
jgi:hypothetical protein